MFQYCKIFPCHLSLLCLIDIRYGPHCRVLHTWSSLTHIYTGYETAGTANSCSKHTNTHTSNYCYKYISSYYNTKRQKQRDRLRGEKTKARNKERCYTVCVRVQWMCDPDCVVQPCFLSVFHYRITTATLPACRCAMPLQAPLGSGGRFITHANNMTLSWKGPLKPSDGAIRGQQGERQWRSEEWDTRWIC